MSNKTSDKNVANIEDDVDVLKELKKQERLARECIEERVVVADSDSLNYGRAETYFLVIQVIQELLGGKK